MGKKESSENLTSDMRKKNKIEATSPLTIPN